MAQHPPVGQGFLIIEDSPSHSDTPRLVGLLWTSNQPGTETSTWQHTTLTRNRHPCPQRDSNPQSQQSSCRGPTPQTERPLGSALLIAPLRLFKLTGFTGWNCAQRILNHKAGGMILIILISITSVSIVELAANSKHCNEVVTSHSADIVTSCSHAQTVRLTVCLHTDRLYFHTLTHLHVLIKNVKSHS